MPVSDKMVDEYKRVAVAAIIEEKMNGFPNNADVVDIALRAAIKVAWTDIDLKDRTTYPSKQGYYYLVEFETDEEYSLDQRDTGMTCWTEYDEINIVNWDRAIRYLDVADILPESSK